MSLVVQSSYPWDTTLPYYPMLATSPKYFRTCETELDGPLLSDKPYTITNNGLEMRTALSSTTINERTYVLTLRDRRSAQKVCILLQRPYSNFYWRSDANGLNLSNLIKEEQQEQLIYIATGGELNEPFDWLEQRTEELRAESASQIGLNVDKTMA